MDFGILLEPIDVGKYDYIRMKGQERWGVFMNAKSPLAGKKVIMREDLYGIPLITTNRQSLQKKYEIGWGMDWKICII